MPDIENTSSTGQLSLPELVQVSFGSFDLYSRQPDIDVPVDRRVFCLLGANGLGKSTFLNSVNFAITGAVPDPDRKFVSADNYAKQTSRRSWISDYFDGRVSEVARDAAQVSARLRWSSSDVLVTRDIFSASNAPSYLAILQEGTEEVLTLDDFSEEELRRRYEEIVLECTGLKDFTQFVFLFHFVLTFDEGRHLLMWDDAALTNGLYLAFGADPEVARRADKLQNDMDRENSRGRNVRFSARHVDEQITQLKELLSAEDDDSTKSRDELDVEYQQLGQNIEDIERRLDEKRKQLQELDAEWADLSSSLTELQLEYRSAFAKRLSKSSAAEFHPLVRAAISEDRCSVCGADHIGAIVEKRLSDNECPLCSSALEVEAGSEEVTAELKRLDLKISEIRKSLDPLLKKRERVSAEFQASQDAEDLAQEALKSFLSDNQQALSWFKGSDGFQGISAQIEKLNAERDKFIEQSGEHYKKRDEIRKQLRQLEKKLKAQYEAGAEAFVPRFRELAEEFIGLPVDIVLDHRASKAQSGFGLRLSMADQSRSRPDKLSESQRFFIDIALRMALAEYMTHSPATLLVDTPEGSLDIAYEARAGVMFSKFAEAGNQLVMTANLRSSELVLRLAELQKNDGMRLVRMMDWADLSQVQQAEEGLFTEAYDQIEAALS